MKHFAVRVLQFVQTLPQHTAASAVARQLARSGTNISANYQAACRGRSRDEFIAKLGVVLEEASETEQWLEILQESRISTADELGALLDEARQLRAIIQQSVITARRNHPRKGRTLPSPSKPAKSSNP